MGTDNNGAGPEIWEVGEITGVSCTAAGETGERISTLLYKSLGICRC